MAIAADDGWLEEVGARWGLGSLVVVDQRVSYPTRLVVSVDTDVGPFVAKLFRDERPRQVEDQLATLIEVSGTGFAHAPAVRPTIAGSYAAGTSVGAVVVMERVDAPLDRYDRPVDWGALGSVVAGLNRLSCAGPFAVPIGAAIDEVVARAEGTPMAADIRALTVRLQRLARLEPTGVVHGEVNPSNAGRRADGRLVLLDWDQAGFGPPALDHGYPLLTCFVSEHLEVDEGAIRGFFDGYRRDGSRIDAGLAFEAALFHALRYMWFADVEARWGRIRFALDHEDELMDLLDSHGS